MEDEVWVQLPTTIPYPIGAEVARLAHNQKVDSAILSWGTMSTKLKGDIAEQTVSLKALKSGWGVLHPIGDRLPYDLVLDNGKTLIKIQVKSAWYSEKTKNWTVNSCRSQTNRKVYKVAPYKQKDSDFAIIYLPLLEVFYIFPSSVFISYKSSLYIVEGRVTQRVPKSKKFREAWGLIKNYDT